jgi:uncharacterized protein (TIGR02569 family)
VPPDPCAAEQPEPRTAEKLAAPAPATATQRAEPPPVAVLRAFGVVDPRPLAGGQGTAWRADGLVLKPDDGHVWEWLAPVLSAASPTGVRVAKPVPTTDGAWTCARWSATRLMNGREPDRSRMSTWVDVIEAGRAFHRATCHVSRPDCLLERTDPWALADRAAWGEHEPRDLPEFEAVARRLVPALSPLGRSQLVHGDLTGNVLFAPGELPAVIDVSPYWRPPAYAEGIVVADALCWHDAAPRLLDEVGVSVPAVARGLLFRLGATSERVRAGVRGLDLTDEAERYSRAAAAIGL